MNKKRVIKVVSFLLAFILLFSACTSILSTVAYCKKAIKGMYAEEENTLDVLLVGASTVRTNFTPALAYRDYGFTSYSLTVSACPIEMVETLVKETLKYQSPKVILVDLRTAFTTLTNTGARRVIDNIEWSENKEEAIRKYARDDSTLSFYLKMDKYHTQWKNWKALAIYYIRDPYRFYKYGVLQEYDFKSLIVDGKHPLKGFCAVPTAIETEMNKEYEDVTEKEKIDKSSEQALYELMDFFKENNIEAAFFVSSMCYDDEVLNEKSPQKINYAKDIVLNYGFECFDFRSNEYNEEIGLDFSKDFVDSRHLNVSGAVKFTDYFSEFIDEKYDLPDHRGDEKYDINWQRTVKAMENYIEYCKK